MWKRYCIPRLPWARDLESNRSLHHWAIQVQSCGHTWLFLPFLFPQTHGSAGLHDESPPVATPTTQPHPAPPSLCCRINGWYQCVSHLCTWLLHYLVLIICLLKFNISLEGAKEESPGGTWPVSLPCHSIPHSLRSSCYGAGPSFLADASSNLVVGQAERLSAHWI